MAAGSKSALPPIGEPDYISRQEWRAAREADADRFSELQHGIRDLRRGLEDLKDRRTDWRPIGIIVSVSTAIIAGFGSVVAWGITSNLSKAEARVTNLEAEARVVSATRFDRVDGQALEDEIRARSRETEERIIEGDQGVYAQMQRQMDLLLDAPLERLKAVEAIASENRHDLASRSGKRFNREDYDKYVQPQFENLQARVNKLEAIAGENAVELRYLERDRGEVVDELTRRGEWMTNRTVGAAARDATDTARIDHLENEVREISGEQRRRTNRVYGERPEQ